MPRRWRDSSRQVRSNTRSVGGWRPSGSQLNRDTLRRLVFDKSEGRRAETVLTCACSVVFSRAAPCLDRELGANGATKPSATMLDMTFPPTRTVLLALVISATAPTSAATITVDCNNGGAIEAALRKLRPGDALLVQGTCRENVLIQSEINGIAIDGQGRATISALDAD